MTQELKAPNNVYSKLATARVMLQNSGIKKTGYNSYSKYDYFQLTDFLPEINRIFAELGLMSKFTMTETGADLTVINTDNADERVIFYAPSAEAGIKGASAIQQLGGVITYMRRYLWLMAMEITEADAIDALPEDKKKPATPAAPVMMPEALQDQLKTLYTADELQKMLSRRGVSSLGELPQTVGAEWMAHRMGVNAKYETF